MVLLASVATRPARLPNLGIRAAQLAAAPQPVRPPLPEALELAVPVPRLPAEEGPQLVVDGRPHQRVVEIVRVGGLAWQEAHRCGVAALRDHRKPLLPACSQQMTQSTGVRCVW